ncbi:MAG: aldo/keto reductase [Gammaproteobacteria bacterium]|nr:aldo/keto reductase [Gammaproteobacteria bacterium]
MSSRRQFLKAGALGTGAAAMTPALPQAAVRRADAANQVRRYVTLGRTGLKMSDISFGSSRLREGEEDLVRYALDKGVNYFDTAEGYTDGQSERVLGNVLRDERERVIIASKTFASASASKERIMGDLEGSLKRLQTDHVDIYFNHAVNDPDRLDNPEWFEFCERAKRQGKIRFTGMSGHAGRLVECLDHAFDQDMVDVVLVSLNFGQDPEFHERFTRGFDLVARHPQLPRALRRAKELDVGVIAMKCLMGARLNDMRPYERDGASFAQAAFRWTLSQPHVDALVISMTSTAKIDEFLGASAGQSLATGDAALLRRYAALNGASHCRQGCSDCVGACPFDVPIADVLRTRMYATDYQDLDFARREYAQLEVNASACLGCSGAPCQDACSHGLAIAELCAPTHRMLA